MLTSAPRWLLLQAGLTSLWMWVLASGASMEGLRGDTRRRYDQMAEEVPWPSAQVQRALLVWLVLPMAALYAAVREHCRTQQEAVDAVTRAVDVLLVTAERPAVTAAVAYRAGPALPRPRDAARHRRSGPGVRGDLGRALTEPDGRGRDPLLHPPEGLLNRLCEVRPNRPRRNRYDDYREQPERCGRGGRPGAADR